MFDDRIFSRNDRRVKGGMFAVWNDYIGNGITFKDIHHRAYPAMQTLSLKCGPVLWMICLSHGLILAVVLCRKLRE